MTNTKQTQDDKTIQPFNRSTIQRVKAYAFTLAETLIVIGIIGVVAALTLPNLNHATGDKEKVTKVKKIYSALTDAVDRAQAVYGDCDTWFTDLGDDEVQNASERAAKRITEFMKVSKVCGIDKGCFTEAPRHSFDGNQDINNYLGFLQENNAYMVTLVDGMSLAFFISNYQERSESIIVIKADIDGPNKGKNDTASEIFDFMIYLGEPGLHKYITNQLVTDYYYPDGHCGSKPCDYSFARWVIENGNLDYLKADYDGDEWTCRDTGKVLDGVTNTSCN